VAGDLSVLATSQFRTTAGSTAENGNCEGAVSAPRMDIHVCGAFARLEVESRCDAVSIGLAYLFPALSVAGASLASPLIRFHIPLIKPDLRNKLLI
jgi:hypothetical protein